MLILLAALSNADRPRFEISMFHTQFLAIRVLFVCESNALITSRSTPPPGRIIALSVVIRLLAADRSPESALSASDLTVLWVHLQHSCALQYVVLAFEDYKTLQAAKKIQPSLFQPLPEHGTFCLVCKHERQDWKRPFPDVEMGFGTFNFHDTVLEGWVEFEPTTMVATGT